MCICKILIKLIYSKLFIKLLHRLWRFNCTIFGYTSLRIAYIGKLVLSHCTWTLQTYCFIIFLFKWNILYSRSFFLWDSSVQVYLFGLFWEVLRTVWDSQVTESLSRQRFATAAYMATTWGFFLFYKVTLSC